MRTGAIAALVLLGLAPVARAGVYRLHRYYNEAEAEAALVFGPGAPPGVYPLHTPEQPPPAALIPAYIFQLRAAAQKPKGQLNPDSPRALRLAVVEHFEPMRREGTLGTTEAVSLSEAYIRLGDTGQAIRILRAADQGHFLVQANLAGAYQAAGELELAYRHQQTALDLWPKAWAGWGTLQLETYRQCERYNLRLLASRLEEARRGKVGGEVDLDPLFPGVRFVDERGRYAAGELSLKMAEKLPRNAGDIVLQLVLWQPNDRRLCWLLAEMLNVHGKIGPAYQLLESIDNDRAAFAGLQGRLKVLRSAKLAMDKLDQRSNRYLVLSELMMLPTGRLGVPGAGDMAYHSTALFAPVVWAPLQDEPRPSEQQPPAGVGPPDNSALPFNLLHVGVSFGFGVLVATLLALQVQIWRRGRQRFAPPALNEASRPPPGEGVGSDQQNYVRHAPP